ncbi:MAG: divergent polysaccharide deacetylase family protein [Treponema sp.]|nr:divergent polysaccharide deacetylase family protein [Treponema sp.]
MAQKKTPAKKTPTKKTSSKRKTVSSKSPVKKGKVAVSPMGLIVLCGSVVIFCMVLLLVTTIAERRPDISEPVAVTKTEKPAVSEKKETPAKAASSSASSTDSTKGSKSSKTSTVPEQKKTDTSKTTQASTKQTAKVETVKKETAKNETVKKEPVKTTPSPKVDAPSKSVEQARPKTEEPKPIPSSQFNFPQAVNRAQLCILLDDGGQNLDDLKKFLALKIPVTVAVLPKLRDSVSSAAAVRAAPQAELMLHQPMQAVNLNVNPGPGAIKPDMTSSEIRALVQENLAQIGPVSGMNNHEGSLITADIAKMETVIDVAHMQGIYFLDSRTNVETKIPYVSRELGYGWYERNGYFLDNQKTREEFLKELRKNLDIANKTGCVIMIAHVWSADYMPALIREVYPELVAKGYSFTTVGKSNGLKY